MPYTLLCYLEILESDASDFVQLLLLLNSNISCVKNPARGHKVAKHHPEGKNGNRTKIVGKSDTSDETEMKRKQKRTQTVVM